MLVTDAHGSSGGIARHNCDLIEALAGSDTIEEILVLPRIAGDGSVEPPTKVKYDLKAAKGAAWFLERSAAHGLTAAKFEFILCGHINLMPVAALIGIRWRIPVVLVIHGIDAWQRPKSWLAGWFARKADLVVAVSELTLERFHSWSGPTAGANAIIPNMIHTEDFGCGEKSLQLLTQYDLHGRKVIMTLGRIDPAERYKGFDEVISLLPRLRRARPDLVYLVCGEGNDRPRLEALARDLGVGDAVRFAGRIPEARKADYYRLADAFVMAGSGEGFGIVILEALACGIPVVASALDGTREAVRNGELGLVVDPRDPDALMAAILEAIDRPKAVPAGLEYFSFDRFAERWKAAIARTTICPAGVGRQFLRRGKLNDE